MRGIPFSCVKFPFFVRKWAFFFVVRVLFCVLAKLGALVCAVCARTRKIRPILWSAKKKDFLCENLTDLFKIGPDIRENMLGFLQLGSGIVSLNLTRARFIFRWGKVQVVVEWPQSF